MQLLTAGEEKPLLLIPPPERSAELPEKVQLATVGEEPSLYIPPPTLWGEAPALALPSVTVKPSRTALASSASSGGW